MYREKKEGISQKTMGDEMNLQKQINELTKEIENIRNILEDVNINGKLLNELPELNKYIEILKLEEKSQGLLIGLKELKKVVDDELRFLKQLDDYFLYLNGQVGYLVVSRNIKLKEWDKHSKRKKNLTTKSEKLSKQIKELEDIK